MFGGGSDDAGFVQVIEGRAKDPAKMRSHLSEIESRLRDVRPDILGITIAWHADDPGFTQIVYFTAETATREAEKTTENDDTRREFVDNFAEPPTFFDLPDPRMI